MSIDIYMVICHINIFMLKYDEKRGGYYEQGRKSLLQYGCRGKKKDC